MKKKHKSFADRPTRHHRKLKCHGGGDEPDNISILPDKIHTAWHVVMGSRTPEQIAQIINKWFIPKDWELIAKKRDA